jgi:hypothetical protein
MADDDDDLDEAALAKPSWTGKQKLLLGLVVVGLISIVAGPIIVRQLQEDAVLAKGTPARAVVLELVATGNLYNETPELRIVLQVTPASGEPWRAHVLEFVSAHDTPKIQPGTEISVKYDPEQPSRVAIVEPELGR